MAGNKGSKIFDLQNVKVNRSTETDIWKEMDVFPLKSTFHYFSEFYIKIRPDRSQKVHLAFELFSAFEKGLLWIY